MKNKIDWINHSVSFTVVLTGILLAFQLTQCTEDRKQKKTIENHRKGILVETKMNNENLKNTLEFTELSLAKTDSLIFLLEQGKDLKSINRLSVDLLNVTGVNFVKNAYNVLVESGDIRFIKDFDGKSETIILYETYKMVEQTGEVGFKYAYNPFYRYIMDNFDLFNHKTQREEVYLSKQFMNLVGTQKFFLMQRIASYKNCQKKIEGYLKLAENTKS